MTEFNGITGNFSKKHILAEYDAGRLPDLLKVIICTVCETPLASELLPPMNYVDFLRFIAEGAFQERNGQITWISDKGGDAICQRCQREMEKLDKEEGVVLYPPKKYSPF